VGRNADRAASRGGSTTCRHVEVSVQGPRRGHDGRANRRIGARRRSRRPRQGRRRSLRYRLMSDVMTGQTVELLQQLIRNRCVNDGTLLSGHESRNSDTLRSYLEGTGLDMEVYEPTHAPGRASLVARIEGSDPKAPTLCLMGHTDVVPVNP